MKFLVTSRPYDDIRIEFQKTIEVLPTIRLQGEEKNDEIRQEIDKVIRIQAAKLANDLNLDCETQNQLEAKLLGMEHRTYLWLYLAMKDIDETYRDSL